MPTSVSYLSARGIGSACLSLLCIAGCGGAENAKAPVADDGGVDVARYALRGEFDWDRRRLEATVDIALTLTGDAEAIELDSAVAEVKAVRAGGVVLPYEVDRERGRLTVDLRPIPGLAKGDELALEVDYEAEAGGALRAVDVRRGDPIASRTVFTMSEPLGAAEWMPCHNAPSDRAFFSIDLAVGDGETLIANGDLVSDARGDGGRRMAYETGYTLPTYLMAFAVGDFEVTETKRGDLPISVWRRRGLPGDYQATVESLSRAIGRYEELLVPYPFEKYALVLVPDLSVSGIENAGITFQAELSSAQPALSSDRILTAHELGHQWFGDLVTVKTWDDVWIKEGMATLLQHESVRDATDESGAGTLNGDALSPSDGDAIRDPSLAPDDKYTSGPYSRAAWLLTQIRSAIGEQAFWGALRGVLESHRFGAIGTGEFLDVFAPALGPEAAARARRAVDAKALPTMRVEEAPSGGAFVTVSDPDGALVVPLDLAWTAEDGATRVQTLTPGERVEVAPASDHELLVLDPRDRHPDFTTFLVEDADVTAYVANVGPYRRPASDAQRARFVESAGAHQLAGLWEGLPEMAPAELAPFVEALDAEGAKAVAIRAACGAAGAAASDPELSAAWKTTLVGALSGTPYLLGIDDVGSYAACNDVVSPLELFPADWAALRAGLAAGGVDDTRLAYLAKFKLLPADDLAVWGSVAKQAASLRARRLALQHLRAAARSLEPAELAPYRALFVDLLDDTQVAELLAADIAAVLAAASESAADNAAALDGLGRVVLDPATRSSHGQAICAAAALTEGDSAAWDRFAGSLRDAPLTEGERSLVASACDR